MQLDVLYFAHAARETGVGREELELPEGATLADAIARILERHPRLAELGGTLQFAVEEELAAPDRRLEGGQTLAVLPPFSGG